MQVMTDAEVCPWQLRHVLNAADLTMLACLRALHRWSIVFLSFCLHCDDVFCCCLLFGAPQDLAMGQRPSHHLGERHHHGASAGNWVTDNLVSSWDGRAGLTPNFRRVNLARIFEFFVCGTLPSYPNVFVMGFSCFLFGQLSRALIEEKCQRRPSGTSCFRGTDVYNDPYMDMGRDVAFRKSGALKKLRNTVDMFVTYESVYEGQGDGRKWMETEKMRQAKKEVE